MVLPLPDGPVTSSASPAARLGQVVDERPLVGQAHGEVPDGEPVARLEVDRRQRAGLGVGVEQAGEADEHGAVGREVVVGEAEERQRVVHLAERDRGLLDVAEGDLPGEVARRLDDDRDDLRGLADRPG